VSQYILRRMLSMVPVLLIVSIVAFGLLYVLPGDPAVAMLGENGGNLYLGTAGLLVGLGLGLSVAVASALRPGSRIDSIGTFLAMGGVAIPSFWQALLLVYVFAVVLRWLPPSGFTSPFSDPLLSVRMLILPAIVLGTHSTCV